VKQGKAKYCSRICYAISQKNKTLSQRTRKKMSNSRLGDKNPRWLGGISFFPYCQKFNDAFKECVRNRFDRKCFLCKASENGHKHHVHHIDYNKNSICNGQEWAFVPLCRKHHTWTTNHRFEAFHLLICYWAMNPDINFRGSETWYIHHQSGWK
jgi:hypothetical protein